jgi:hypothetical protein
MVITAALVAYWPTFVLGAVSPPAVMLGAGLQWLLQGVIRNTWVRVVGSLAVACGGCGLAFAALIDYFAW